MTSLETKVDAKVEVKARTTTDNPAPLTSQQEHEVLRRYLGQIESITDDEQVHQKCWRECFDWIVHESRHLLWCHDLTRLSWTKLFERYADTLERESKTKNINSNLLPIYIGAKIKAKNVKIPILARLCRRFAAPDDPDQTAQFYKWLRKTKYPPVFPTLEKARKGVEVYVLNKTPLDKIHVHMFIELCVMLGPILDHGLFEWLKTF